MADRDMTTAGGTDLRRLKDLDDYQVADGYPDIRGWEVKTPDGQTLGEVKDLVVSVSEMRVRYLDVEVDRKMRGTSGSDDENHALVPIGTAELNDDTDNVIVSGLGSDMASYPRYAGAGSIPPSYETRLRDRMGAGAAAAGASSMYDHAHYDDQRLHGRRSRADSAMTASARPGEDAEVRRPVTSEGARAQGAARQELITRRESGGLRDRLADAADDTKDRMDADPASRPGRDATDRPSR